MRAIGVYFLWIFFANILTGGQIILISQADSVTGNGSSAHRTDWFKDAKWGIFTHYLSGVVFKGETITVEKWNRAIDEFDVEALANQLEEMGAGYYIITLGQNSGFYCSPNGAYDHFVGIKPSKCSKRDLIADLYDVLHPRNIRLMVYLPSGAPDRDPIAMQTLEWCMHSSSDPIKRGYGSRLEAFQHRWEAVIREWSERWGSKVSGWWFDGCYYSDKMYFFEDSPNFESFAAAARAGNPNSIVAFNPGVIRADYFINTI